MLIHFQHIHTIYNLILIFIHFLDKLSSFSISPTISTVMNYADIMTKMYDK